MYVNKCGVGGACLCVLCLDLCMCDEAHLTHYYWYFMILYLLTCENNWLLEPSIDWEPCPSENEHSVADWAPLEFKMGTKKCPVNLMFPISKFSTFSKKPILSVFWPPIFPTHSFNCWLQLVFLWEARYNHIGILSHFQHHPLPLLLPKYSAFLPVCYITHCFAVPLLITP